MNDERRCCSVSCTFFAMGGGLESWRRQPHCGSILVILQIHTLTSMARERAWHCPGPPQPPDGRTGSVHTHAREDRGGPSSPPPCGGCWPPPFTLWCGPGCVWARCKKPHVLKWRCRETSCVDRLFCIIKNSQPSESRYTSHSSCTSTTDVCVRLTARCGNAVWRVQSRLVCTSPRLILLWRTLLVIDAIQECGGHSADSAETLLGT